MLVGNKFSVFPDVLNDMNILTLNLSKNFLTEIPKTRGMQSLKEMNVFLNKLKSIECIRSMTSLQTLCLRANQISALPQSFAKMRSLTELDVSNNRISSLDLICELESLKKLEMIGCCLSSLEALCHVENNICNTLEILNVSRNIELVTLPSLCTSKLYELRAMQCNILSVSSLQHCPSLRLLYLDGNVALKDVDFLLNTKLEKLRYFCDHCFFLFVYLI